MSNFVVEASVIKEDISNKLMMKLKKLKFQKIVNQLDRLKSKVLWEVKVKPIFRMNLSVRIKYEIQLIFDII